jgi:hypothetical protein
MSTWQEYICGLTDRQRLQALDSIIANCFIPLGTDAEVRFHNPDDGPGELYWNASGDPVVDENHGDSPHVVIDGVRYVPAGEVPPITDERLKHALRSLTEIQYFSDQEHKHRAWAWDALNFLAPEIAEMASQDASAAFNRVRDRE